jgi:hypothetical protein
LTIGSLMIVIFACALDCAAFDWLSRHTQQGFEFGFYQLTTMFLLLCIPAVLFTAVYLFVPRPLDEYARWLLWAVIVALALAPTFFG